MEEGAFDVQEINGVKGKGLFATKFIKKGSIIFEEEPLVCCQFSWNEAYGYRACDHCMRPLETSEENARRLTNCNDLVLPHPECCPTNQTEHVACPDCNTFYCSKQCKTVAWDSYHKMLCHKSDPNHPLNELKEMWKTIHYPPESTCIMLLAKIVALVEQAEDKHAVVNALTKFSHSESTADDNEAVQKLLGLYRDQIELLRSKFERAVPAATASQHWLSLEGFTSLLAIVGTNGQGVGTSVFSQWVSNVGDLPLLTEQRKHVDDVIDKIYEKMEEHVGMMFLNNEGSALYRTQSCINHSCDPNSCISFIYSNSTLTVIAEKDILPGEEICISYLDECNRERSRHSRQKLLRENYFFNCLCMKCLAQVDDPDDTSDEDDDCEDMTD